MLAAHKMGGTVCTRWLADPAGTAGREEEIMKVFRSTRDDVQRRVREPIQQLQEQGQ